MPARWHSTATFWPLQDVERRREYNLSGQQLFQNRQATVVTFTFPFLPRAIYTWRHINRPPPMSSVSAPCVVSCIMATRLIEYLVWWRHKLGTGRWRSRHLKMGWHFAGAPTISPKKPPFSMNRHEPPSPGPD